ncbi:DUF3575 domain-containing protein [Rhodocytophaga aerolata]|uniref:DUF3575 domain-containing protein n=1 Tax=Rhodocytophaga aerolata TaxID=455078 RepID=A0ABT8R536_9BACT|nr:DUF3575 domain-containing protein [Rhodocytophaga aerolata]MDO1447212.1 DUF3575 domain-containing protein [Rhodocytophaga aerolata]
MHIPKPAYIIKWAPFSAVDIDPTIQFGLEYLLKGNWSLQQELGYGHYTHSKYTINGDDLWNKEVWRSRSEVRLYLGNSRKPAGVYTAFEVLYKRVNFNQKATLGRECADGMCNYFEEVAYKVLRDVVGYHVKIGGQALLEKRIALDFYTGLGFRNIYVKTPGSGDDGQWRDNEILLEIYPTRRGNYRLISMNMGFKMGYLLYRN